jgi:hypothetical protein
VGTFPGVDLAMAAARASRRRDDRPSCNLCQAMVCDGATRVSRGTHPDGARGGYAARLV